MTRDARTAEIQREFEKLHEEIAKQTAEAARLNLMLQLLNMPAVGSA